MMFRMARRYDFQTDSILFSNNQPYSRDSYNLAGMGETIEDLLHFCRTMYSMKVDNAEYALLTAIVIFSGMYKFSLMIWHNQFLPSRTAVFNGRLESGENPGNIPRSIKGVRG